VYGQPYLSPTLRPEKNPRLIYSRSYVYFAIQVVCNVTYIEVLSYVRVIVVCKTPVVILRFIVCFQYHDKEVAAPV
jgi:hypothetical protein